jgi:cell division septation protein DedD
MTNVVHPPASTNAPAAVPLDIRALPSNTIFTVQLGAFTTRERAFSVFWEFSRKIPSLQLIPPFGKDKLYRVSHGSFATYDEARAAADKLKKENIDCFVTPVGMPELAVNVSKGD